MKGLVAVLAVPFALVATEAQAGDLDRAVGIAHTVFQLPCQPKIEIAPTRLDRAAEARPDVCEVRFRPGFISESSDAMLCNVTVHEWGHLAGLNHTSGGRDVMDGEVLVHHPACGLSDKARLAAEERRVDLIDFRDALREGWRDRRCNRTRRRPVCRRIARKLSRVRISLRGLA